MKKVYSHWAVCDDRGAVVYDPDGRAEIFETKARANKQIVEITERENRVLHAEKVVIE